MNIHRLVHYLLLVSLACNSALLLAERYQVTEDSFGSYSAKPVKEEEIHERGLPSDSSGEIAQENSTPSEKTDDSQSDIVQEELTDVADVIETEDSKQPVEVNKSLSIFEQKYLESERKAQKQAVQRLERNKGNRPYDATEINEADFVDGDALLEYESGRSGDQVPYFTAVDTDGYRTNTSYDIERERAAWEKFREQKKSFTEAKIYKKSTVEVSAGELNLPEGADPVAFQILYSGKDKAVNYFDAFTSGCCAELPAVIVPELILGRSYSLGLDRDDVSYRFNEGDSRYLLLHLPDEKENFPFLIRTFIHEYKKRGIEHGVFFPQLITLDAERKPLRIITGPLLKYVEETWTTYGYLEGIFEIDRTEEKEEQYVLINTTKEVLKKSSVIEGEEKQIQITHMNTGLFEVKLFLDN